MNKKILSIIVVVLVLVLGWITYTQTVGPRAGLAQKPYVDSVAGYSIYLPKKWGVLDTKKGTTTSQTWFNSTTTEELASGVHVSIGKFVRNFEVEGFLKLFGEEEFLVSTADTLKSQVDDFTIVSKEKQKINGREFMHVTASYTGKQSKKQVVQNLYMILTDTSYYVLGIDAYAPLWPSIQEVLLKSVNTFTLLE